jgi:LPS-assembly lipoprotein
MRGAAVRIATLTLAMGLFACGFHLRGEAHYAFATLFLNSPPALPITTELKRSLEGIGSAKLVTAAAGAEAVL